MPTVRNKNNYDDESTKQKLISYDDIYNYFIESNDQINLHHIVIDVSIEFHCINLPYF